MELLTLILSSALFTAVVLFQLSFLSCAPKPLAWCLPSSLYRVGSLHTLATAWLRRIVYGAVVAPIYQPSPNDKKESTVQKIIALVEHHEIAELLSDMIQKDGANSWPPNTNHAHTTWPTPLQPYKEIYLELAPLLPQATPSLNDEVNILRIENFRQRFRDLLNARVDLVEVAKVRRVAMIIQMANLLTKLLAFPSN